MVPPLDRIRTCNRLVLFHVTHRLRINHVLANGLNPKYSRGRKKRVWLCAPAMLGWVCRHLGDQRRWSIEDMRVVQVVMDAAEVRKIRPGIFTSYIVIPSDRLNLTALVNT